MTRLAQILAQYGVDVQWLQLQSDGTYQDKGNIRAFVCPLRAEEVFIEPGYGRDDYQEIYTETAIAHRDRFVFDGNTWEALPPKKWSGVGETFYLAVVRRRLT